ncbi:MAG: iron ABC transporter permease, partial [Angelakisella sp.]
MNSIAKKKPFYLNYWNIISLLILLLLALFLIFPLFNLVSKSFFNTEGALSMENYVDFFSLKHYTSALQHSFLVCSIATVFAMLIGVPLAYLACRFSIKGKKLFNLLIVISMLSPPFIGAYAWIILFGRSGFLRVLIGKLGIQFPSIYGFGGIILVFTIKFIPLIYLYVSGAIGSIDASLEEAAENLGMSKMKRILTITFPLILPTITAAMLMVFMAALADFGTPMLIGEGYKVLPVLIYQQYLSEIGGDAGMASTLSVVIIFFALLVLLIQRWIISKRSYTMSMLNPPKVTKLTGWRCALATGICFFMAFVGILPQLTVLVTSFLKTSGLIFFPEFSLDNYRATFAKMGGAILHTFSYSTIAIIIMVLLGILISYLSVRKRSKVNSALDLLVMFPYVIPGAVMGIALLLCFNKQPLVLTGTWMILVIAYVVRKLPYTIRSSSAILYQLDPCLEE